MPDLLWILKNRPRRVLVRYGLVFPYGRNHEPRVQMELRQRRGNVFYDIGANTGFYSVMLRRNFHRIFACEPNPSAIRSIKWALRWRHVHNVVIVPVAISGFNGQGQYWTSNHSLLQHFQWRPPNHKEWDSDLNGIGQIRVPVQTFDSLNERFNGAAAVDLCKIDVEGSEFEVLKGMSFSLRRHVIRRLLIEIHDRQDTTKLESQLSEYGYSWLWIDFNHLLAETS